MTTEALELRGVRAAYGRIEVLRGIDLVVPGSTVVALLGPNGAGKSTVLKVAAGRLTPTAGCVHVGGHHVNGASTAALAGAGVCTIPEGRGIFPNLTVEENLRITTYSGAALPDVLAQSYSQFPKLGARSKQVAGTMSGGEQQMLAMARALTSNPRLLLLDEISMGLAPLIVGELYDLVGRLAESGIAILLVEQFASTALAVADVAVVMANGLVQAVGEPDDVRDTLSDAYLGGAA